MGKQHTFPYLNTNQEVTEKKSFLTEYLIEFMLLN